MWRSASVPGPSRIATGDARAGGPRAPAGGQPGSHFRLGRPQAPSELSAPGLSRVRTSISINGNSPGPGARAEVYFTPRMVTTDMLALREAAMAGVGVVQLPLLMVRDQLASGELEVVLDEWQPRREVIHAVFASRRGLLPSVRALVDYLSEEYQRMEED